MTIISANVPNGINSTSVEVYKNNEFIETAVLDKDCGFSFMYPDDGYEIVPEEFIGYTYTIEGTTVTYHPKEISLIDLQRAINSNTEDITETQMGLAETFEYLINVNDSITVCEEALAELYEIMIGV